MPRETRRLLAAAFVSFLAIWALARVRFADQPASPNPVGPLLSQLAPRLYFEDLASQIAAIRPRIESAVFPIGDDGLTALRIRQGVSLTLSRSDRPPASASPFERIDRASGLVVVETATDTATIPVSLWSPSGLDQPRYLIAAVAAPSGLRLIPTLAAALEPMSSPVWPGSIWAVGDSADLPSGAFVFTENAQLVGVVTLADRTRAIVPAATLVAEMDRLLAAETAALGWLGVDAAPLTPALTRATGASTGVIVAAIDPRSPAASTLHVGDVVESINGDGVDSMLHWQAHVRRLSVGQPLALRVQSKGATRGVTVVATAPPAQVGRLPLGLDLRRITQGSEVLRVAAGSVADAAGLRPGDVIVHAGETTAPAPAQLRRLFAAAAVGQPLLIAIERGGTYHVMPLEKDAPDRP